MRTIIRGLWLLVVAAPSVWAQLTQPIGTLQPKTQAPPVLASYVNDTVSFPSTWTRAPFDTALKAVGSRFVCAKAGIGYVIGRYSKSANKTTTVIYVDTVVVDCFPRTVKLGASTARVSADTGFLARVGAESRAVRRAEAVDVDRPTRTRRPR